MLLLPDELVPAKIFKEFVSNVRSYNDLTFINSNLLMEAQN